MTGDKQVEVPPSLENVAAEVEKKKKNVNSMKVKDITSHLYMFSTESLQISDGFSECSLLPSMMKMEGSLFF